MTHTHHHARAFLVLALTGALLLTGCGPGPLKEGNTVTPTQAKADVRAVLDDAVTFLGGPSGWSPGHDDNPFLDCTVQGHPGHYIYWDRQGPGPGSEQARDALAKSLLARLEGQGYTAYIAERNPKDPRVRVYANSGRVEGFSAYISPDYISIEAQSWCVTGTDTPTPSAQTPTPTP